MGFYAGIEFPEPQGDPLEGSEISYSVPTGLLPLEQLLLERFESSFEARRLNTESFGVIERSHTVVGHYTTFIGAVEVKTVQNNFMNPFKISDPPLAFQWILRLDGANGVNLEIFPAEDSYFPANGIVAQDAIFDPGPAKLTLEQKS